MRQAIACTVIVLASSAGLRAAGPGFVDASSTFTVGDATGPNLRGTFVAPTGGKILLGRAGNEGR